MAQKKISELPLTKTINNADTFPLVQKGVTKQISYGDFKIPIAEDVKADSNLHSTKEDVAGTWIDGRRIYRRVIQNPTFNSDGATSGRTYGTHIRLNGNSNIEFMISARLIFTCPTQDRRDGKRGTGYASVPCGSAYKDFSSPFWIFKPLEFKHDEDIEDEEATSYDETFAADSCGVHTPKYLIIEYVKKG